MTRLIATIRFEIGAAPAVLVLLLALTAVSGCGRTGSNNGEEAEPVESVRFLNTGPDVGFVGDAACFDCHEDEYRGYQTHGMAKSIYPLTADRVVESFDSPRLRHPVSGFYYRAVQREGGYWQEEVVVDANGREIHRLLREMNLVTGSGSAARTYLTESNGRLYELPLTWYTQSGRWDFSPGYADASIRFDRRIPDRCMACHNSYPNSVPFVEGKYEEVPFGIGCERCHGPGELHVQSRLAGLGASQDVDVTIVNPAHLSLDRRLDVCQQCHLHSTVSLLRDGRHAFDFRPSQPLDEYIALFAHESDDEASIPVISHADRMKRSPCFLSTAESEAPMDCMTCHDPHQGFRDFDHTYFNRKCVACHAIPELQAIIGDVEQRAVHTATANCFSCHMPRVEAEDAPHASFTDHFIRVVDQQPVPVPNDASGSASLEPYFQRDRDSRVGTYYAGMAYIALARQQGERELLEQGVALLKEVQDDVVDQAGEGRFLLGIALAQLGRGAEAIPHLEEAVRRGPDIPERLNALAQAYEAQRSSGERVRGLYQRALEIQPAAADIRVNYGRFLEASGNLPAATREYEAAAHEEPWLETAHFNLGTAHLRNGNFDRAETSLLRAVELKPSYVEARGNLAVLYLQTNRPRDAQSQFELAVELSPEHPVALANLGTYYVNAGLVDRAVPLLERALEFQPDYVTAMVNLAVAYVNLNQPAEAERQARRALQLDPANEMARQVLLAVE